MKRNNERRVELIRKDLQCGGLSEMERAELDLLETWVDEWVSKRFPLPDFKAMEDTVREVLKCSH